MATPTEDQIRTAFRMLNFPYAGPVVIADNVSLNSVNVFSYGSTTSVQTRLRAWLLSGMDVDSQTKACSVIDEYTGLRSQRGFNMQNGAAGNMQGVSYDPRAQIADLIADLQNLVPFYHELRELIDSGSQTRTVSCGVLC